LPIVGCSIAICHWLWEDSAKSSFSAADQRKTLPPIEEAHRSAKEIGAV
jgi:hypothetical protein